MVNTYKKISKWQNRRREGFYYFNLALMDSEYKKALSKSKIKVVAEIYSDELFSSWLVRTAIKNFTDPATFINLYFPKYKNCFWNRDVDILLKDTTIKEIAQKTNLTSEKVYQMTLRSYEGYLNENFYPTTRNNLISPIKVKGHYSRKKGLKFCPLCLEEKEYFKKEWRLLFVTVCLKHKCFLIDACLNCDTPITIHKRTYDIPEFNCYKCGFKFKESEPKFIHQNSKSVEILNRAIDILNKGWFSFGGKTYYSIVYFKIVKQLAKLIYLLGYRNNNTLLKEMDLHNIKLKSIEKIKELFLEDFISMKESFVLFSAVFDILSSKEQLVAFIKDNKMPIYHLRRDLNKNNTPFFYENVIWNFKKVKYSPTTEEVENAVNWMKGQGMIVNWKNISKLFGVWLDKRKRPDIFLLLN